jgi:hypothetical protein
VRSDERQIDERKRANASQKRGGETRLDEWKSAREIAA